MRSLLAGPSGGLPGVGVFVIIGPVDAKPGNPELGGEGLGEQSCKSPTAEPGSATLPALGLLVVSRRPLSPEDVSASRSVSWGDISISAHRVRSRMAKNSNVPIIQHTDRVMNVIKVQTIVRGKLACLGNSGRAWVFM